MYSLNVSFVLGGMVVTGAARSIVAKLFYQFGFEHPLFLTLLYLSGQALSLVPYNIWRYCDGKKEGEHASAIDKDADVEASVQRDKPAEHSRRPTDESSKNPPCDNTMPAKQKVEKEEQSKRQSIKRMSSLQWLSTIQIDNSVHGLPAKSKTQPLIERIPWYIKPAVPAFFNLLNSAMRWASLIFVAASVAEMLISGTELVLSVLATRCVRGRMVTRVRWIGVLVCTVGIIMVGIFDSMGSAVDGDNGGSDSSATDDAKGSSRDQIIGIALILGQSMMSVIQDLTEELFMQEADFPPALLVGMEGSFGLIIALVLYFPIAPLLGEQPSSVLNDLANNDIIGLAVGWTLLVTITAVFNIAATGVTSSMTRNVWKNLRTCLVWALGLIIFYATGNPDLGEEWVVPASFYILLGFAVMLLGIFIYYGRGSRANSAQQLPS